MLERLLLWMLEKPEAARPTAAEVEAELTKLAAGLLEPVDALSWAAARAPQRRDHNLPLSAHGARRAGRRARQRQGHAAPLRSLG